MKAVIQKHPFVSFLLMAFGITWLGSLVAFFISPAGGRLLPAFLQFPASMIWYFGPCIAASLVITATQGKRGFRQLWQRYRLWRVGWQWYAFILFYPLGMHLLVSYACWLLGGPAPRFFQAEGVPEGSPVVMLVVLALLHFFQRGLGEETGWRGFALPYLQRRWSTFSAALLLGLIWALWHFHPVNFHVLLSITGVFLFVNITLTSVILAFVYRNTGGSLLIAALFHMTMNVSEYVIPTGYISQELLPHLLQIAVILLVILALLLRYGVELDQGAAAFRPQTAAP